MKACKMLGRVDGCSRQEMIGIMGLQHDKKVKTQSRNAGN